MYISQVKRRTALKSNFPTSYFFSLSLFHFLLYYYPSPHLGWFWQVSAEMVLSVSLGLCNATRRNRPGPSQSDDNRCRSVLQENIGAKLSRRPFDEQTWMKKTLQNVVRNTGKQPASIPNPMQSSCSLPLSFGDTLTFDISAANICHFCTRNTLGISNGISWQRRREHWM